MITERILAYGRAGSGKSRAWLKMAERLPSVPFLVVDTDESAERSLSSPGLAHIKNVKIFPVYSWDDCETAQKAILALVKTYYAKGIIPWIVVDMIDSLWDFVQGYFTMQIFGKKIDDYFLEARKAMKKGAQRLEAFEGWKDWQVINKLYQDWINTLCYQAQANIFLVAKSSAVGKSDDSGQGEIYGPFHQKPEGEKRNDYRVHTVILFTRDRYDWYVTTVKDRERRLMDMLPMRDFALQYLMVIAGHKLEKYG